MTSGQLSIITRDTRVRLASQAFHRVTWPASVPAVVIVSEQTPFEAADAQWWREAHQQFVNSANNLKLMVADRSSHDVAHDRPDVIIQAVADLVASSKSPQPILPRARVGCGHERPDVTRRQRFASYFGVAQRTERRRSEIAPRSCRATAFRCPSRPELPNKL
jgi:hypothetical protein